jgi:hypothetical protein
MAAPPGGSIYQTPRNGLGIRWLEGGKRRGQSGFRTRREARDWFDENVAPRLRRARAGELGRREGPSPDVALDEFLDTFLERHGPTVAPATRRTLEARLKPARKTFGPWSLRELEGAAQDIAAWRARLPASSRYQLTSALRQALGAAVRWRYLESNPAVDAGRNPQPRAEELMPFTLEEVDAVALELGPAYGPLVVFCAATGLRTNEWTALERRDQDSGAVVVQRRYADGALTPYPKTARSRRRVPLSARAEAALDALPPRLDTPLLFPAPAGGPIDLHNWRRREWYPALEAAGSSAAARTTYGTRSPRRRSRRASASSSWPG